MQEKIKQTDFLIIGSGISGLYLSSLLSEFGAVTVVTKDKITESNTYYAQGGIASVMRNVDSFESHIKDTINAGSGLCNIKAVELMVREGPSHIQKLMAMGTSFVRKASGDLDLHKESGHSQRRIVHSTDVTGKEIEESLVNAARKKNITILEHTSAVELLGSHHLENNIENNRTSKYCFGAYIYSRKTWDIIPIRAKATILATGGAGQVYLHSTNPSVATGDGIALAYRLGAKIANMEFYQFHPTTFYNPKNGRSFLLSEALRGEGGIIRNSKAIPFLKDYDPRGELATRDIVARAIDKELKESGAKHAYLDMTHLSKQRLKTKFPNIYNSLLNENIDISKDLVPIVPAAHYMCGGVFTDLWGQTNIAGLYALGETACTGVHGGNRLASNSLLESLVFASQIAKKLKDEVPSYSDKKLKIKAWKKENLSSPQEWIVIRHNLEEIKRIMWNYIGIHRSNHRLKLAQKHIRLLLTEIENYYQRSHVQNKILELRNLSLVASLIIDSALSRKESRGLHYNSDYPINSKQSEEYTFLVNKLESKIDKYEQK